MDVGEAWEAIERVLRAHLPAVAATLRPPAAAGDLERLAEQVGHDLPADLLASLAVHDGQDNPTRLLDVFDHHTLLGVDGMAERHRLLDAAFGSDPDSDDYAWMTPDQVRTVPNLRGWLPVTESEGTGYAVDLDPLPTGTVGQVIWLPVDGPTPAPVAASYGAWFSGLAEQLAAGAFEVDETGGLWLTGR
ncbi:SMI1/KNR4 family protein [Nocardioides litoris]|uniref:SMI1/KNR4 family protein n=1 Tax=Nocardioides litoris TaxID=1926648 RepID=UPI00112363BF|nr:SMI1/KNR4 family protein [Nocardioides litoris]